MNNLIEKLEKLLSKMRGMSIDDLVFYDVKNEWIDEIIESANKRMRKVLPTFEPIEADSATPLQKICCYRVSPLIIDCDVSLFSMLVYAIAYNIQDAKIVNSAGDKYYLNNPNLKYKYIGDTMNSYATSVHMYFRNTDKENKKQDDLCLEKSILCEHEYFEKLISETGKKYLIANHTIGNLIPVPGHFNLPRYSKTKDYWDLTLDGIYRWYCEFEEGDYDTNTGLEDILSSAWRYRDVHNNIGVCKSWLEGFGTWDNFVETHFMQDFVDKCKTGDRKHGRPKEFWTNHFDNRKQDLTNLNMFFGNASSWVLERGRRIASKLKEELNRKSDREIIEQLIS